MIRPGSSRHRPGCASAARLRRVASSAGPSRQGRQHAKPSCRQAPAPSGRQSSLRPGRSSPSPGRSAVTTCLDVRRAVTARDQALSRPGMPGSPTAPGPGPRRSARPPPSRSTGCILGYMGRIIGTILGAILAIWLAVTAAGGIFATLKAFLIIGLIALAVFIVVWFVAGRPRRG